MYDKERGLFEAFVAGKMSRRELLQATGKLGLSASAAGLLVNQAQTKALAADFDWMKFKGTKLKLTECSVPIVEQINLISNFTCGGNVESIFVPFSCTSCKTELVGLFRTEDLKKLNFKLPEVKCSKCGGRAIFDDIPEEYLGFLER